MKGSQQLKFVRFIRPVLSDIIGSGTINSLTCEVCESIVLKGNFIIVSIKGREIIFTLSNVAYFEELNKPNYVVAVLP